MRRHRMGQFYGFMNVAGYKHLYSFKDGGLAMYSGNYFGSPGRGVFVVGFKALRWLLDQLGVEQPRRFKNEPAFGPDKRTEHSV